MKRLLVVSFCLLFLVPALGAGESLIYSVSSGESEPSPRITKTDIFAVDPQGGTSRLIFSDAGAEVRLLPAYCRTGDWRVMAAAGGRLFARGVERKLYTGGGPSFPTAVFERSVDGSGRARKVFDIEGEQRSDTLGHLFVSPSGAKIGYMNYLGSCVNSERGPQKRDEVLFHWYVIAGGAAEYGRVCFGETTPRSPPVPLAEIRTTARAHDREASGSVRGTRSHPRLPLG